MVRCEEKYGEELSLVMSDPIVLEINRLHNQIKEKVKELAICQGEVKALRSTEALKDKAIEELRNEVSKLDERLRAAEDHLKQKNLEIKKLTDEKKEALAAQYAAEATLRRVHANQKDEDSVPIDNVIAPLEAEIKMYRNKITTLHEDKKALERLKKSKETALLEGEKILQSALERALRVEEVQNQNFDLKRQIDIYQEENKILEKSGRQKILEVEKLGQTIHELEEVILANGAAANVVRDYQRQISELQKRTLERELARVRVSANRIANVVAANEWKGESDKVMPVKQWLEERRIMQAEMQRLKDKLTVSERTAKAESQLKEKLKVRLKTLEAGLKHFSSYSATSNVFSWSPKEEKSNIRGFLTSGGSRKRSTSQPRASSVGSPLFQQTNIKKNNTDIVGENSKQGSPTKKNYTSAENMLKKGMWVSRRKVADSGEKENEMQVNTDMHLNNFNDGREAAEIKIIVDVDEDLQSKKPNDSGSDDVVSSFLYDRLQKEVINLRISCENKDSSLHAKDEEIKLLMKKVDALTKSMEVEWKKTKREAAAREKEVSSIKPDDSKKIRNTNSSKRLMKER
ncbi:microtubule-associated protein 70-5-like isoform X2 [Cicer arietinum]|uniref:microtubule-associated protein 70-5-like isoform X2 n=1 Tax=Cicer arietinum TaxID=3827 RepID=UPI003CC51F60